jgi:hypothetical protein
VFLNLFLNARDAMESGGRLTIATASRDGLVRLSVKDSGSGIAPENLTRVFDPFFTTKGARKGTGLGLSVSYGIVREHGGDIEVESELGNGARFLLSFPEIPPAAATPQIPTPQHAPRIDPQAAPAAAIATASISTSISTGISTPSSVPSVQVAQSDRMIQ